MPEALTAGRPACPTPRRCQVPRLFRAFGSTPAKLSRSQGTGLRFECEAAVKAFFGDATTLPAVRAQLATLVAEFDALSQRMESVSAAWLTGELRYPERVHYTAMSADLISHLHLATRQWASTWLQRLDAWDGTGNDDNKRTEAHDVINAIRATVTEHTKDLTRPDRPAAQP